LENVHEESQKEGVDMSNKLRMPTRPKLIKLMPEERVNWYLVQIDNPAFIVGLVRDGIWEPIKEKLILSLTLYKIPIPDELN
jgi:hypothetical protein